MTAAEPVLLIALLLLSGYAGWGESRTIAACLGAVRTPASLTRLGAEFLLTEVAVLAVLGLAHAAYPLRTHAVTAAAWLPLGIYFAGWMLRDVGLWLGPVRTGRLRWAVVGGAGVQALALATAGVAVVTGVRWPSEPEPHHAGTAVVAVGALLALAVVGALRLAWGRRGFTAARFAWR